MNKKIIFPLIFLILAGAVFAILKFNLLSFSAKAAIQVDSTPKARVFIDSVEQGVTPFESDKIEAGEHQIRLVPLSQSDEVSVWESTLNLTPGIYTVVNRNLGKTSSDSSGIVLSMKKTSSKKTAGIQVISIPDQAVVKLNGESEGFAPVKLDNLTPGSYELLVSLPGYEEKQIPLNAVLGYNLEVRVQLAQAIEGIVEEATSSADLEEGEVESAEDEDQEDAKEDADEEEIEEDATSGDDSLEKPYVKIKETPTGWLKVRSEPSSAKGDETVLTRVDTGETFSYLDETTNGWYKIEYKQGEEGWVSGVYAELVE